MESAAAPGNGHVDEVDLRILVKLLKKPEGTYKDLSTSIGVDPRTVARRVQAMQGAGVLASRLDIDWSALGIGTRAVIGCTTAGGGRQVNQFLDYVKSDPRIVAAYETVGDHQYVLEVLESDFARLRNSILKDLEPLTADLVTSVVTSYAKRRDYSVFARYLMETKYPRTRVTG